MSDSDNQYRPNTILPHLDLEAAPEHTAGEGRTLVVQRAAEVKPEKIRWLWPGRTAIGKLTLIGGSPGLGKSQITAFLAAATSSGGPWPCAEGEAPHGSSILLSAEDGIDDTIVPRLLAAGADLTQVHLVSAVRPKEQPRQANV